MPFAILFALFHCSYPPVLGFGEVFDEGFHDFVGLELDGAVGVGGAEEVCPLEDFGETELVEGGDDGADGGFAADDEDFDGFAVGVGVGVEFEGEF